jgi:hypothetical protein
MNGRWQQRGHGLQLGARQELGWWLGHIWSRHEQTIAARAAAEGDKQGRGQQQQGQGGGGLEEAPAMRCWHYGSAS